MNFSTSLGKPWQVTDDRILYDYEEIKFEEIMAIKIIKEPSKLTPGIVGLVAFGKNYSLPFGIKQNDAAQELVKRINHSIITIEVKRENTPVRSREDIMKDIKELPKGTFSYNEKDFAELPNVLYYDEKIMAMTSGFTNGSTWLIVCTNKRVLFLDKGLMYGLKQIEIPLTSINGIASSKGIAFGKIAITDGAKTTMLNNVPNSTILYFTNTVNEQMNIIRHNQISNNIQQISPADEILKYKKLFDDGIITQDQFEKKKNELLQL